MALPSVDYAPRDPAADVLHRVVREHLQTFLAEAAHRRDGEAVPRFVEDEFQAFLACGWLAGGFARFQCVGCQAERLVAFSCCLELKTIWSISPGSCGRWTSLSGG